MSSTSTNLIDIKEIFSKVGLTAGMRVADLGCGRTGHFVFPASKVVGDTGIVYAVDVIKNVLENIKSTAKSEGCENVRAVWSNIELVGKTTIPEHSVDVCFFINSLYQLNDRVSGIKEACRLLKNNGFLAIVDWKNKIGALGPELERMIIPEKLIDKLGHFGLELVEIGKAGDYHFLLLLRYAPK